MTNDTPIVLSHASALALWRRPGILAGRTLGEHETQTLLQATGTATHIATLREVLALPVLEGVTQPLDLLTSDRNARRTTTRARLHCVQTSLPEGSLVEVGGTANRVIASAPELCFVQMANRLTLPELVLLGYELCGSYSPMPDTPRGYVRTGAVTTPERLLAFAQSARNVTGAKLARSAAKWVVAGAPSPEDAKICALAHMSRTQGGMGTTAPLLGQTLEAPDPAARILGTRRFTPALYWPDARVVVEFTTRDWQNADDRATYDKLVRSAYRMMGISAISLGRDDLHDDVELRKHFDLVNRKCKRRLQPPSERHVAHQRELLALIGS